MKSNKEVRGEKMIDGNFGYKSGDDDIQNLDEDIVLTVLYHSTKEWNNNILALESYQANLFYSDAIFSK